MTVFPINRAPKARGCRACSPVALPFTFIFYRKISAVKNSSTPESPTRLTADQKNLRTLGTRLIKRTTCLQVTRHRASIKFLDGFATPMLRAEFVQYCCRLAEPVTNLRQIIEIMISQRKRKLSGSCQKDDKKLSKIIKCFVK